MDASVRISVPVTPDVLAVLRAVVARSTVSVAEDVFVDLTEEVIKATKVDAREVVESYRVRGEIAEASGKNVYGHLEFVEAMEGLVGFAYVGSIVIANLTIIFLFDAAAGGPVELMIIESFENKKNQ